MESLSSRGRIRGVLRRGWGGKEEADLCGMTARKAGAKAKAKAKATANTGVSPLRCAPVEMTEVVGRSR
jgi:hypothetical protein